MGDPVSDDEWASWCVVPESAFEVHRATGRVGVVQVDAKRFDVSNKFRFSDPDVLADLTRRLLEAGKTSEQAAAMVEDARTFTPPKENPTDLASIPQYMRWFENTYGKHTLAALLHDELIVTEVNGGALESDTLADRFFREMMRSAKVPWLKRWIIWTAVALRSRWAASSGRRTTVIIWIILALFGIACFVDAIGGAVWDWWQPFDTWILLLIAFVLPFASAPLWGKQWGASLIAAIAALWILPAAAIAGLGWVVYKVLELGAGKIGLK